MSSRKFKGKKCPVCGLMAQKIAKIDKLSQIKPTPAMRNSDKLCLRQRHIPDLMLTITEAWGFHRAYP